MNEEALSPDEGLEALAQADWVVTKIGGLNACDFQGNFGRINQNRAKGKKQVVVLSVPRTKEFNTTTHLNQFVEALRQNNTQAAGDLLTKIQNELTKILEAQVESDYQAGLLDILDRFMQQLRGYLATGLEGRLHMDGKDMQVRTWGGIASITGWGEDLAEALYKNYFAQKGGSAAEIRVNRQEIYADPSQLRAKYSEAMSNLMNTDLILTGGYEAYLGRTRGYSDPKAALITASLAELGQKAVLAIEKEYGIFSADPTKVGNTRPVAVMSSTFAAEVFGLLGGEAGAVHHLVLPILNGSDAKIVVFDPARTNGGTTCIHKGAPMETTTVVSQKVVPTIRVHGPMSNEEGIAKKIMEALAEHSLDHIYTAENEVRVTLSASGDIENIEWGTEALGKDYSHTIESKAVVVCVSTQEAIVRGGAILHEQGIRVNASNFMAEVGGDAAVNVSTYVVKPEDSTKAVKLLHNAFAYAA